MFKRLMILVFVTVGVFATQNNICFEYPSSSYIVENTKVVKGIDPLSSETTYKDKVSTLDSGKHRVVLAIKKKPTRLHNHYIFLIKKSNGKILGYKTFSCPDKSLTAKRFYCYGACDGGIISFEENREINFKTHGINIGDSPDAPEGFWEIKSKYEADMPTPRQVKCPDKIASMNISPNENNKKYIESEVKYFDKPVKYVCYRSKSISKSSKKAVYHGCRYTKGECNSYYPGWKKFGYYPDEQAAMKAFERCRNSAK